MKKIIISLLSISLLGLANASEQTGELKSTATMNATCSISTASINFGVVATPLMMQTANSDMIVKCSNSSAYTINLAYGGIYGTGSTSDYSFRYRSTVNENGNMYSVITSTGSELGYINCGTSGHVAFNSSVVANYFGYPSSNTNIWVKDNTHICSTDGTLKGTTPNGWVGAYNATGTQPIGGSGYEYGIMNGVSRGDKLAYSISVPTDSNKVWNTGSNSYKATGNGDIQTIPMNAKIVPDKSGSKYPAPDMYSDTVTAIISY